MGFGDFLKAGASALGVDTDDIGGFFDKAKGALGGEGDAGDLFSAAAKQFGIDADDVTSAAGSAFGGDAADVFGKVGSFFGGGSADGGGSDGGFGGVFGGAVKSLMDDGDVAGSAQEAFKGGFGSLFGGDGSAIVKAVSDYLPPSVTDAISEAGDLPFVQNAAAGNWADLAGSVPGLNGALGSFGLTTQDVGDYIQSHGAQAVDGGSAWSFGNMLADRGTQFLQQVAAPVEADSGGWGSLGGWAHKAGVDLPSWASDLRPNDVLHQGGRFLEDGGFMPAQTAASPGAPDSVWGITGRFDDLVDDRVDLQQPAAGQQPAASAQMVEHDDTIGESQVQVQTADLDEFASPDGTTSEAPPAYETDYDANDTMDASAVQPMEAEPPVAEEPAPPPEQYADTADALQSGLEDLGDETFA